MREACEPLATAPFELLSNIREENGNHLSLADARISNEFVISRNVTLNKKKRELAMKQNLENFSANSLNESPNRKLKLLLLCSITEYGSLSRSKILKQKKRNNSKTLKLVQVHHTPDKNREKTKTKTTSLLHRRKILTMR